MLIKEAEFIKSSEKLSGCPKPIYPEYAFFGRSNVGKSSLINMLTGRKSLAKTSSTPGKTRLINHFLINRSWYLADLPGFGYAKISKTTREKWEKLIKNYLLKRQNLINLFFLIDIRHKPLENDLAYLIWLGENHIPFTIVFTKIDKLSKGEVSKSITLYSNTLSESWDPLPQIIKTSSTNKLGKDEILQIIEDNNKLYREQLLSGPE